MKIMSSLVLVLISFFSLLTLAARPAGLHPGSDYYEFSFKKEKIVARGRDNYLYLPTRNQITQKFPVIVYGHGQALNETHYELTFQHLAQKGIAVIYVKYDTGFFDRNWRRMASDFNGLTKEVLTKYSQFLDSDQVHYAGHSKGGYVSLMAAGAPNANLINIKSVISFAPAGFDEDYIKNIKPEIIVSLFWGEKDSVIDKDLNLEIFSKLTVSKKQFIEVLSVGENQANHFFPLTKSSLVGGSDGINSLHYQGTFKWLIGAVNADMFLYSDQALETGVVGLQHLSTRMGF